MKNTDIPTREVQSKPKHPDKGGINILQQQLEAFEKERTILLALSNDITVSVCRERNRIFPVCSRFFSGDPNVRNVKKIPE